MEIIKRAQGRKKCFERLMLTFRPLIGPLKRFEGAIGVMVQTNSGIASPIWGPLRIVITLVSDRMATLQNLAILLERIVEPWERFRNYETLFKSNAAVQSAIGSLYCDLINFCAAVARYHSRAYVRTSILTLD
jgi:hypothetical protein